MSYLRKGILIILGMACCCAWVYMKGDTLKREAKMITKIFKVKI